MSYPQQTFPNFNALLTYINTQWVTNGNGDITGIVGNNVVNGLLTFIEQSPLNYQKATVSSSIGAVVISQPVTIFTQTPSALSWSDNIYNQIVIINTTVNVIPLLSGFYYRDIDLNAQTTIPAKKVLILYKATNNEWIQGVNYGTAPGTIYTPDEIEFGIGEPDSPMIDGQTQLIIAASNVAPKSVQIFLDGIFLYKNRADTISYTVVYNPLNFVITFNQGAMTTQWYNISYAQNI